MSVISRTECSFYLGVLCAWSPKGSGCTIVSSWCCLVGSVGPWTSLSIVLTREATGWAAQVSWQGSWEAEQAGQCTTDTGQSMFLLISWRRMHTFASKPWKSVHIDALAVLWEPWGMELVAVEWSTRTGSLCFLPQPQGPTFSLCVQGIMEV